MTFYQTMDEKLSQPILGRKNPGSQQWWPWPNLIRDILSQIKGVTLNVWLQQKLFISTKKQTFATCNYKYKRLNRHTLSWRDLSLFLNSYPIEQRLWSIHLLGMINDYSLFLIVCSQHKTLIITDWHGT